MALVNSEVQVTFEEVYKRDEKDNIIETKNSFTFYQFLLTINLFRHII